MKLNKENGRARILCIKGISQTGGILRPLHRYRVDASPIQGRIQTVATVARAPVRFSSSDFKPKSKFTKKCFYMRFLSLKMDVFFFSVSIKFFEPIKDLVFSVHLLLYTVLQLYFHFIWVFRYTMIRLLEVARVPTARNCARIGLLRSV